MVIENLPLYILYMECYRFYKAASQLKMPCLCIKSISDLGYQNKDNYSHQICSYASAMFLYKLLLLKENFNIQ